MVDNDLSNNNDYPQSNISSASQKSITIWNFIEKDSLTKTNIIGAFWLQKAQ